MEIDTAIKFYSVLADQSTGDIKEQLPFFLFFFSGGGGGGGAGGGRG